MIAYLGLGSNIGDREGFLRAAVEFLDKNESIAVKQVSSIYETAPVGYVEQANFFNAAARIETDLTPEDLLKTCMAIEAELGRRREVHWGPRTIDIDILLFDGIIIETPLLTIPHPQMHKRRFVLVPLNEIYPDLVLKDRTITEILGDFADSDDIRIVTNWTNE